MPDTDPTADRPDPDAPALEVLGVAGPPPGAVREGRGATVVLEGVVETGVEAGAVVLRTADGTWLVGRDQAPLVGHRVRVTGAELHGVLTTAQQGPPLVVDAVEDLGTA